MNFSVIEDERFKELEANILFIKAFLATFQDKQQQDRWLSKAEAQQRLKCSKKTLENWMKKGLLTYSQIGHKIYIQAEVIENFLKERSISK